MSDQPRPYWIEHDTPADGAQIGVLDHFASFTSITTNTSPPRAAGRKAGKK
jgi:hypothetical protein